MSVCLDRRTLTPPQEETIRRYLCFQPKVKFIKTNARFAPPPSKDPIFFFRATPTTVTVPYFFGSRLIGQPVNRHINYPPAPFQMKPTFKWVREDQGKVSEEALTQLQTYGTTTLGVYTGFGKTVIGAWLSHKLGLMTCVIFFRNFLATSWKNTFEEFTDAGVWVVGQPIPEKPVHVILCMHTQVHKLPEAYRALVGTLIVDEAHTFCAPEISQRLLDFQPRYVIAETATLEREDGLHSMIHAMCGLHQITRISQKPFDVIMYNTGIQPPVEKTDRGTNWQALQKFLAEHQGRNEMILSWVQNNPQRKTLIMTDLVSHAQNLHKMCLEKGVNASYFAGAAKTYTDAPVLIGTLSKIGTGFDEKMVCPDFSGMRIDCLLLVTSIKSIPRLEQGVGRAFRSDMPVVIHFVDDNPTILRHWKGCQKWYISRNGRISAIHLQRKVTVVHSDGKTEEVAA